MPAYPSVVLGYSCDGSAARAVSKRQRVSRLFSIDGAVAAGATGVEREMVGDPRAGPEPRVARHELRQVVAGLRVAAEARERHVRAELAALELDAAVARDARHLLLQPVQPLAAFDGG